MTNLEEEIEIALLRQGTLDYVGMSKAAAEVAKRWIEKAIDETKGYRTDTEYVPGKSKEEWFKENGITS